MNAITLGPLVLAADRFAVVLGMFVFIFVTGLLARRIDESFHAWTWWVLIGGAVAARLGHVLLHWRNFVEEPLRILAFWDESFYWPAGVAVALLSIVLALRTARLRLWALLPLVLTLVVWNTASQLSSGTSAIALPASTFESLAGERQTLAAGGTPKVINLWASWCPPCRREMPMMAKVADSSERIQFIFANQGESREIIERYLFEEGIALGTVLLDRFGELGRHYGAPGLPATLFIDEHGVLKHAHLGEISRETLRSRIGELRSDNNEQGDD
jgi:thiol-disulfide isomerase/thioredoxin